jgi:hypothetical protein
MIGFVTAETSSGSEVVGNLYANQLFAELSGDMPDRHRNTSKSVRELWLQHVSA